MEAAGLRGPRSLHSPNTHPLRGLLPALQVPGRKRFAEKFKSLFLRKFMLTWRDYNALAGEGQEKVHLHVNLIPLEL